MLANVAKRFFQLIPVLLGVSVVVFLMMSLIPGDPVQIMIGDQPVTKHEEALMRHDLGLDQPPVERYFLFIGRALIGNFGRSFFQHRPVIDVIGERLPATIELTLVAMIVAIFVGVSLGILAAVKKNTIFDRLATVGSLFGVSLPGFWFGILLIMLFAVTLRILPVSGRMGFDHEVVPITHFMLIDTLLRGQFGAFKDALAHIILPAITLGLPMAAILMRVTRSSMLEVLRHDYMVFAEAKGLGRWRILTRHALKNALIPTVTVAALETGALLGGNMIVETVFGWPGLGRLVVESIFMRDYPLVQAAVLLYAVTYVLLNFIADVLYTLLNPKVRL